MLTGMKRAWPCALYTDRAPMCPPPPSYHGDARVGELALAGALKRRRLDRALWVRVPPRALAPANAQLCRLLRCPSGRVTLRVDLEASALQHTARLPALAGRSPLLRLQSDEKLVALIRRGHHGAFEALVQRYQPRLLAFCRHMLGSPRGRRGRAAGGLRRLLQRDLRRRPADQRAAVALPDRAQPLPQPPAPPAAPPGQDSMDVFERDGGITTADTVHQREEFRQIVADVQELPETQRTALLLREIDALSYDQIAEAMDTTVPSVKSLLVRARVALAEAAEARLLTCDEVRLELGQVAEGIATHLAPRSAATSRAASAAARSGRAAQDQPRRSPRSTRSARCCSSRSSGSPSSASAAAPAPGPAPPASGGGGRRRRRRGAARRRPRRPAASPPAAPSRPASPRSPRRPPPGWPPP